MKPLIENPEEIKLNEFEELQQILGNPPKKIFSYGNYLIVVAVIILIAISRFIQYPDVIVANIELTTENPPIEIIAKTDGNLARLFVEDYQEVEAGKLLGIIENPAELDDVKKLEQFLDTLEQLNTIHSVKNINAPNNLTLGSLQTIFSLLSQHLNILKFSLKQKNAAAQVEEVRKQIKDLEQLNHTLEYERNLLLKDFEVADTNYQRQNKLLNEGVTSKLDNELARRDSLQTVRLIERQNAALLRNKFEMTQLRQSILALRQNEIDKNQTSYLNLIESIKRLRSEIKGWKQTFLLIAPAPGTVLFSNNWSENQFISNKQTLLTITPAHHGEKIFAQGKMPVSTAGKVKLGQKANIQLLEFPYKEYGMVEGRVTHIGTQPDLDQNRQFIYQLRLDLPNTLHTSYDSILVFRQNMPGQARIITEKRSFFRRVLEPIYNILYNQDQ